MSFVDSLVAVIGKPRRIVGADYSEEAWGVVPQAAPQAVFEGVHLHGLEEVTRQLLGDERAARTARVETPRPKAEAARVERPRPVVAPVPELPPPPAEEEIDWELALEAAKVRASALAAPPVEEADLDWEAALAAARARVA